MKLSEFKLIMPHLPSDTEIIIKSIGSITASMESTLVEEHWGNHDGRYNVKCTVCGWVSDDIQLSAEKPTYCPRCGGGKY